MKARKRDTFGEKELGWEAVEEEDEAAATAAGVAAAAEDENRRIPRAPEAERLAA